MNEPILYEVREHAAWITLNTPDNHNALSGDLSSSLEERLRQAQEDDSARMIVLAAEGRTFCAGADLKGAGGGAVRARASGGAAPFVSALNLLWDSPKPVIGRIQGNAFGGGLGLIAACDFAICADTARFAFTEVRLGLAPAIISVLVMRKMALADATPLFLLGERFTAEQARQMGLVYKVVPADALDEAVSEVCQQLLACGPQALKEVKNLLRVIPDLEVVEGLMWAEEKSRTLFDSEEGREGMAAFAAKRKPNWIP